ncbi:MAG: heat-inducible transcriptional repressor HrcA, partial [Pseudomonadota bacterium]|nr:heat-inducible transcriptional repressor HrcA [Pseudomonadota bacterium]
MNSPPLTDLSDRAREIFRLVVEGYLDSGAPVGSKALSGDARLNLSPASIRNVLADLEARGLLAAPHTSAGRMPTETGLRLFVDAMMQVAEPTREEREAIEQRLGEPGPIERALEETSALLSDLYGAAGMVMVPTREPRLAQVSLTALDAQRVLAVLVGEDGHIENRILAMPPDALGTSLEQASNYLTARSSGRTLAEAAGAMEKEIASGRSALDEASRDLVQRGIATWSEDATNRPVLIVRGQSNLLDETALGD